MLNIKKIGIYKSDKILSFQDAVELITKLKSQGREVGLCHGAFDFLHPGHIKHFESAKQLCDVLFVSITSDKFVTKRKGAGRPIYTDKIRAYSIASIKFVDYVIISNFKTGIDTIKILKPDYYIKGLDYIHSTTRGIAAEREAIASVGGEIKYTNEPKLATTEIINYIKNKLGKENILLILDRDGTLIVNNDFLGKNQNWKDEIKLKSEVIDFIYHIQSKYNTVKIVISNQAGVARNYFSCKIVEEINRHISKMLLKRGINIDNWQYCPYVDFRYTKLKKEEVDFNPKFVSKKTKRKPSPDMVYDGLKALNKKVDDFSSSIVIGDKDEDEELAKKLNMCFISVNNKTSEKMIREFEQILQK